MMCFSPFLTLDLRLRHELHANAARLRLDRPLCWLASFCGRFCWVFGDSSGVNPWDEVALSASAELAFRASLSLNVEYM